MTCYRIKLFPEIVKPDWVIKLSPLFDLVHHPADVLHVTVWHTVVAVSRDVLFCFVLFSFGNSGYKGPKRLTKGVESESEIS